LVPKAALEGMKTVMLVADSRLEVELVVLRRAEKEVWPVAVQVVERGSARVKYLFWEGVLVGGVWMWIFVVKEEVGDGNGGEGKGEE
jgi:hypothetical protein